MQGFFEKVWQAIRGFFSSLFGTGRTRQAIGGEIVPLSDTDHEFLFMQLLEGVQAGWHEGRILKFFDKLGDRGRQKEWVEWIERFGDRLLLSNANNQQLALRMIRLGELARAFPGIERIGDASYHFGYQLYSKETENLIWEYEGSDMEPLPGETFSEGLSFLPAGFETTGEGDVWEFEGEDAEPENIETFTIEELSDRLQNDPSLAAQIAARLGIEGEDAGTIIDSLIANFQSGQLLEEPDTVEGWFARGMQQVNAGDWEGAIASWDRALAIDPEITTGWHNRGSALAILGRYGEALESLDRALALDDDYRIWDAKGSALYGLERYEEALSCWERVLKEQPDFSGAWYNRGSTLEKLDRRQEAIECYKKSLELEPDFDLPKERLNDLRGHSPDDSLDYSREPKAENF